ncbi:MAG: outer membrane beta-barrel domain-containing protein [Myxococcales bacterium]|nr:outer membrane beta-barrel domain-containing protein [Myxococcales bacterium]
MHVPSILLRLTLAAALLVAARPGAARAAEPDEVDGPPAATDDDGEPGGTDVDGEEPGDEGGPEEEEGLTSTERLERAIRVLQRRPIVKDGRFELTLTGGIGASDRMYRHVTATATGRFHVSEFVSIGATYAHYFSSESKLYDDVTGDFELFPERSEIRWYAGADVSVVPIDGKFAVFDDGLVYWDIYGSLGGGVTTTSRGDARPTGMVGLGLRFYFAKWLALTFEVRDHIFIESYRAGNELVNNVVGQGGFSFFIPFGFDYEYPR